jgi:hypothetical protein
VTSVCPTRLPMSPSYGANNTHAAVPMSNCRSYPQRAGKYFLQTGTRRNTMWRPCFSVTFLKCGERLFASFSTRIHHVWSDNTPGLEPSALRRQSRDARTTGQRNALPSGTTVYALSKLLCMHAQPQPPGALHQLSKNNIRAPHCRHRRFQQP